MLPAGEDGYASASEGYFSATESVSSMRSGRSFGKDNSFSGPRAGLGASGRRASGADSDSDDEVRSTKDYCRGSCASVCLHRQLSSAMGPSCFGWAECIMWPGTQLGALPALVLHC